MYRLTADIDLANNAASLGDKAPEVKNIYLVQPIGISDGMYALITLARHDATLITGSRMGLHGDDALRALESFRRWLKMQDIPMKVASLRFASPGLYVELMTTRSFATTSFTSDFFDPALSARFQEWLESKPVKTPLSSPRLI